MFVILPTSELIVALNDNEELFLFSPDGARGVVRDMVLNAELEKLQLYNNTTTTPNGALTQRTVERLLFEYRNSPLTNGLFLNDRIDESARMEIVLDYIDFIIANIFIESLGNCPVDVSRQYHGWVGDNLVIKLEGACY